LLKDEIAYWPFLETWVDPLPWRDERHVRLTVASDASGTGWGGCIVSPAPEVHISDYWTPQEQSWYISVKEAVALEDVLLTVQGRVVNARVDALVDNMVVFKHGPVRGAIVFLLIGSLKACFSLLPLHCLLFVVQPVDALMILTFGFVNAVAILENDHHLNLPSFRRLILSLWIIGCSS
jgi:hypothetical protein